MAIGLEQHVHVCVLGGPTSGLKTKTLQPAMPSAPMATPLRGALWPGRETPAGLAFRTCCPKKRAGEHIKAEHFMHYLVILFKWGLFTITPKPRVPPNRCRRNYPTNTQAKRYLRHGFARRAFDQQKPHTPHTRSAPRLPCSLTPLC